MLSISKKSDYGLILLSLLAKSSKSKKYLSIKKLSKENNLPYKFLSQIAQQLKSAKILKSKEGISGGYRLNGSPKNISLDKILAILENSLEPVDCLKKKECVCQKSCLHKKVMRKVSKAVINTVKKYSLSDLVAGKI